MAPMDFGPRFHVLLPGAGISKCHQVVVRLGV